MPQRTRAQVNVSRRIAADPTSAVLLLAAPAAAELWPGVTLAGTEPGEHITVDVSLPDAASQIGIEGPIHAQISAELPVRTPTSFVIRFAFTADSVPATTGTLTLEYARGDDEDVATDAQLSFTVAAEPFATPAFLDLLHDLATTFLDNLAGVAEERSRAA